MDLYSILTTIALVLTTGWGVWERRSRIKANLADARESNGQYVASLATAAHELVETYRGDVKELRERISRLEAKLEIFGCRVVACPNRLPFRNEDDV